MKNEDQNSFFPTVGALLGPLSVPGAFMVIAGLLRLKAVGLNPSAIGAFLLKYIVGLVLYAVFVRSISQVRLSRAGVRGSTRTVVSWPEITEVVGYSNLFISGVRVRSAYKNSVWIHRSVWTNPNFAERVAELASDSILNQALVADCARARAEEVADRGEA